MRSVLSETNVWASCEKAPKICVSARHARQTARISFLDPLPLFKENDHLQGKGVGASILVDPLLARGLAMCHDEISLPNRVPNQLQNQHSSLRGFFTHNFNCVCRSSKSANRTLQTWAGPCCSVSDNGCRLRWDVVRQLKAIEANHWNRRFSVRISRSSDPVPHRVKAVRNI